MRRRAKADSNQPSIVAAFRAAGLRVVHTHMVGGGFPDIIVGCGAQIAMVEIKDGSLSPSRRALTPAEADFHAEWPVRVIETVDQAVALALEMALANVSDELRKHMTDDVENGAVRR